jgi:hypothetical protein
MWEFNIQIEKFANFGNFSGRFDLICEIHKVVINLKDFLRASVSESAKLEID